MWPIRKLPACMARDHVSPGSSKQACAAENTVGNMLQGSCGCCNECRVLIATRKLEIWALPGVCANGCSAWVSP